MSVVPEKKKTKNFTNTCPIRRKTERTCCEAECSFVKEHKCLFEKYYSERNLLARQEIFSEALYQNEILKAQIRYLETVYGVKL
ncbi:tRNA (guanosine(18)-2'-O)-methyltransferase [Frankliniella fusca]|uniref:tRNA (Guanosine(18)-2'-O)-methyltransferase n=1 Tax=Frankliniella fusca TaxID=407009 RepID=A0AAE1GVF5_9NEOP|nr:tRNA (guanosine(18)-2'-O)-methyltransferase [Frankliniella fusca]